MAKKIVLKPTLKVQALSGSKYQHVNGDANSPFEVIKFSQQSFKLILKILSPLGHTFANDFNILPICITVFKRKTHLFTDALKYGRIEFMLVNG